MSNSLRNQSKSILFQPFKFQRAITLAVFLAFVANLAAPILLPFQPAYAQPDPTTTVQYSPENHLQAPPPAQLSPDFYLREMHTLLVDLATVSTSDPKVLEELSDAWREIELSNIHTQIYFDQLEAELKEKGLYYAIEVLKETLAESEENWRLLNSAHSRMNNRLQYTRSIEGKQNAYQHMQTFLEKHAELDPEN